MSSGLSDQGFTRKRLDEILSDKNQAVRDVFGDSIDLSPEAPDGQINGTLSESDANLWELAEAVYNAFNPSGATGAALDNVAALAGLTRLSASKTRVTITCFGTDTTVIPSGSIVESTAGDQFVTIESATIGASVSGEVDVIAEAVEDGQIAAAAGSVTTIITPVVGWDTVTNAADAEVGRLEETDAELRERRTNSVAFPSQSLLDSIFSSIANLDDVRSVTVLENETDAVDGNGQIPHSVQAVVTGGDDQEIAEAIFLEKAAGIQTDGTTTVQVIDSQDVSRDIKFTRPTEVPIYVIVNLTTDASYPTDGDDLIKQALVDYGDENFGAAEDVIYSRLYTPINEVPGHQIDSLFIDVTPAPVATSNISIAFNQISKFTIANITVNS